MNFKKEDGQNIKLDGRELNCAKKFKKLGVTINENGDMKSEIEHRVSVAWMNWKKMSGVLCDRRMSMKLKGKIHKTVVRTAMMYEVETWSLKKNNRRRDSRGRICGC